MENWKWKEEELQNEERTFSILETTEICFGSTKMGIFYWETRRFSNHESRLLFASTYFCNHCNIRFENTSKYVDTLILFSKNLNQRSLTPTWPLTSCLLRSHVWLYPRIIASKSNDNTSMYVDTVINFANYHIYTHTTYILHTTYRMSDHIVS